MNKVNKILSSHVKTGLERDLDEERWSIACEIATEELKAEIGDLRNLTDREINCRACEVLGRK